MKIFILGVNGFIGSHLAEAILETTAWEVIGLDVHQNKIDGLLGHEKFTFKRGDINHEKEWILEKITASDIVIPLAAIATPMNYVKTPLAVFHSVFETNMWIIKECARLKRRIIFPSTSEVYGKCEDSFFHEKNSSFVLGPINKERWIYSCSKQLLDRVIWAYGKEGLPFTIFRPFNWIGHSQDDIEITQKGGCRVVPQFLGNIFRAEPLLLVDGGEQRRSFTDIRDGIDALVSIIHNDGGKADGKIFNIGNQDNNVSIKEIAEMLVDTLKIHPEYSELAKKAKFKITSIEEYYGSGYQDVQQRVPDISEIRKALGWYPVITLRKSIEDIVNYYVTHYEDEVFVR